MAVLVEHTNLERDGFVIKPSKIHGFGLFAAKDFKSGEVLLYFENEAHWFINHSCVANCRIQQVYEDNIRADMLIALRDIPKGEEITWDYRITRWKKFWKDLMERKCNCPKCKDEKNPFQELP